MGWFLPWRRRNVDGSATMGIKSTGGCPLKTWWLLTSIGSLVGLACDVEVGNATSTTADSALAEAVAADGFAASPDPPDEPELARDPTSKSPVGGITGPPSGDEEFAAAFDAERRAAGQAVARAELAERARARALMEVEFVLGSIQSDQDPDRERGLRANGMSPNGSALALEIADITSPSCGHPRTLHLGATYLAAGTAVGDVLLVDDARNVILIGGAP